MKIFKQTISISLWETLSELMELPELQPFRLVGGTSLSLLLGHRVSVDIDLFTDAAYGSINFEGIERILLEKFPYVGGSWIPSRSRAWPELLRGEK